MMKILLFLLLPLLVEAEVTIKAQVVTNQIVNFENISTNKNPKVAIVVNQGKGQPFVANYSVNWAVFSGPGTIDKYGFYMPPVTFLKGTTVIIKAAQIGLSSNTGSYYIILR